MTCYWKSVLENLDLDDFKLVNVNQKPQIKDFIKLLKSKNKIIENVTWQNEF